MFFCIFYYLYIIDKFSDLLEEQVVCICDDFDGYCLVRIEMFYMMLWYVCVVVMLEFKLIYFFLLGNQFFFR